ncbi:hypothetical protein [Legionella septentrionalis]|uniref:hypothetical protein n=1 Tax=Legionella septentrionalis TaxID=2498109 RepID=UPI000F8D2D8B|nr:hypothetical protein [Legionella septentrionalis]RUQ94615.1 hypothetical protein ELY11_10990 [Legionella septentrionalis]
MSNKKIHRIIGLGVLLLPMWSWAADSSSASPTEMPKDEWLDKVKKVIPDPICKGFMEDASISARLKERNISYQNCVSLIPSIADKCINKYYDSLPAMINQESASKWGRTIGECIGGDFAVNHLYSGTGSESGATDSSSTGSGSTPSTSTTTQPQPAAGAAQ